MAALSVGDREQRQPEGNDGWETVHRHQPPAHSSNPRPFDSPARHDRGAHPHAAHPDTGSPPKFGSPPHGREAHHSQHSREQHPNMTLKQLVEMPCGKRCQEWMFSDLDPAEQAKAAQDVRNTPSHCPHHRYLLHADTALIAKTFDEMCAKMDRQQGAPRPGQHQHSSVFYEWLLTRRYLAERNPHIQAMFSRRSAGFAKSDTHGRTDSKSTNIGPLFDRFIRYAADIDSGLGYVELARAQAEKNGEFTFIDIGFAPGGMAALLTDVHKGVRGVGYSLGAEKGGNVFPATLGDGRFNPLVGDVVALARDEDKVSLAHALIPGGPKEGFPGFDLLIAGITTSGSDQAGEMAMDEVDLKDLLHFSQLYVGVKNLRTDGQGCLLMRMHLGMRAVELHLLSFVLENFSSTTLVQPGHPNIIGHKPLTEFAMRKTFWVLAKGFSPKPDCAARLRALLNSDPKKILYSPFRDRTIPEADALSLFPGTSIQQILTLYADKVVRILHPQWIAQLRSLKHLMGTRDHADKLCGRCRGALMDGHGGKFCGRCERALMPSVLDAIMRVDGVVKGWRARNPGVV